MKAPSSKKIASIHSNSLKRPIVWTGVTKPGSHTGVRYSELLPRFRSVESIYEIHDWPRWRLNLKRHIDRSILGKYIFRGWLYPKKFRQLSHRYQALFCTDLQQVRFFPGPIIVDDNDPVFSTYRIGLMNRPNVAAVVTTTELLRDALISSGLDKPCHVIPSGVDLSQLDDKKVEQVARTLGKVPQQLVVGFSIPFAYTDSDPEIRTYEHRTRSISFLIEVMDHVWQEMPSVQLWLLGHPSRSVQSYAASHRQVQLLGYVPHENLLNYLANFDIAVYPRLVDFQGRHSVKLLEYMGCGCPIVSTTVAESFLVTDSGAGVLASDAVSFARHIIELASNPERRQQLGQQGIEYARAYDWDVLAERYEREVFHKYLGNDTGT